MRLRWSGCLLLVCGALWFGAAPASSLGTARAAGCTSHMLNGAPSKPLLSILGVLRQPKTKADAPPARLLRELSGPTMSLFGDEPFVTYIRLARVSDGVAYYVVPIYEDACAPHALPHTPFEGASLYTLQGGAGPDSAADIERRGTWTSEGGGTGADPGRTLFTGIVPDGVSTVTLHYPAGKLGGFSRRSGPALTVTAPVVNNVVVVSVERAGNQAQDRVTTIWRAANGKIIKILHGQL